MERFLLKMRSLKSGPEICHSNYVNMFTDRGLTWTSLINILGNYAPHIFLFIFIPQWWVKQSSLHKILQEQQDNHSSWGTPLDEIVSANATLKSMIPMIVSGIHPSISLQGCYEKQKDISKCMLTHKTIKQHSSGSNIWRTIKNKKVPFPNQSLSFSLVPSLQCHSKDYFLFLCYLCLCQRIWWYWQLEMLTII